jgi:pimeloyl-ACP methyl ester carboxylesterase
MVIASYFLRYLFVVTILVIEIASVRPAFGASMAEDFDTFQSNPNATVSAARQNQVDQFSYLFVGGYGNEAGRDHYFQWNAEMLREMGATHVDLMFPSSMRAAADNLARVRDRILRAYYEGGEKPVVVMGHSKGGLEVLATLLAYPDLVTKGIVANAVLIQAPIGGNTLLDQRGLIGRLYAKALSIPLASFRSLMTPGINSIISDRIEELTASKAELRAVSRVVRYVISHKEVEESGAAIRAASKVIPHQIPNDGLVAKMDMWIPGFGTILGDLYIDHLEVVLGKSVRFIAENVERARVRAFTKSLIINLMKSRNPDNREYRKLTEMATVRRTGPFKCEHIFLPAAAAH